ncbi:PREDICTED: DNA polymerase epsilon subunit 4-like [Odobenus rosmarus divergens]|uniref:DNA polymerase epsilon subunit 4-like n=1 Tax=Odobenus rosmarus divergens TaxID=9708 RepID=A0A9B0LS85_ODORO
MATMPIQAEESFCCGIGGSAPGRASASVSLKLKTENGREETRSWRLLLAQVKAFVEADLDVTLEGQEAIFILAQASETIANSAYCCAQQGKRKTLQRRDLDNEIEAVDEFAFLEGTLA